MVWFRPKQQRWGHLVNASFRRPEPAERLSPVRSGHVAPAGDGIWTLLAPEFAVSTHAVIGDDTGRPDRARGGVFSYLGIVPGTTLTFDVVLPDDVTLALAEGEVLRLGRSRKDDFGQASVTGIRLLPARQAREVRAGEQVRVWCVSDVLLRDAWGAFDPSPRALAAELSSRLGAGFEVAGQRPGKPAAQAYRAARRESFHTRWNRPRPSLTSLAAGSVLTLAAAAGIQATALAEIERDGVGERTAEGFGQVRFGAPELDAPSPILIPPRTAERAATTPERPDAGNDLPAVPHILEQAAVKAEVARRVASLLTSARGIDGVIPGASQVDSRAQWGVLREQLPGLGSPAGRESAERWLAQTRAVRTRRRTWSEPALDALTRLLTDPAAVWASLGLDGAVMDEFALAPQRGSAIREALWPHAVSVLLTEIARTATRRLQGEPVEQPGGGDERWPLARSRRRGTPRSWATTSLGFYSPPRT